MSFVPESGTQATIYLFFPLQKKAGEKYNTFIVKKGILRTYATL
jgi:hypothetical protein